ncbi:hypothetical protein [Saccharothrix syringae]|uniref:Uncharacterized protein n=1 Tax=Saccharothrix syringae TaxID=103733 RepID=A0A5Q0GUG0_SACSY|nr:hypothetical protein [Saccharothrix syringae]QFZ17561.1 hypothetical protein EKG83_08765 [Saccharothrix syringae]
MNDENTDADMYAQALSKAADFRDDRLNSQFQRVHWSTVHRMLTAHAPVEGNPGVCVDCGQPWPCEVVTGAVKDLGFGPAGG